MDVFATTLGFVAGAKAGRHSNLGLWLVGMCCFLLAQVVVVLHGCFVAGYNKNGSVGINCCRTDVMSYLVTW
ncbi:unnamed protein product [Cuscuta campestris]|uniref:Uncharacterized protein n=1 Tax=Cuscuta campestris TaxID=132261 RepID=A0A484KD85_9ASTE|nr:unnamed protein product [Cuscuta campestris]